MCVEKENCNHSPVFSVMKDYRVIRSKHTFHDVVSLISRQSLEKKKKQGEERRKRSREMRLLIPLLSACI